MRRFDISCLYLLFDGEQHRLCGAHNIKRAHAELYLYASFLTGEPVEFRVPA